MKLHHDESAPATLDLQVDGRDPNRAARPPEPGPQARPTLAHRFMEQPLLNSLLVIGCIVLIVIASIAVGPASQSGGQITRTATVKNGVVQATVAGSGNVQSANQLNLGFKTSGTVTHIYVSEGEHVTKGQLLATLDPKSAEVSLEQAKATLQSAEANLAKLEETEGETSSGQSAAGTGASATAASTSTVKSGSSTPSTNATSSTSATTPASSQSGSSSSSKQSAATREANLASARAAVKSDKLTVQSAEQSVQDTNLYAPGSGTIVTLSGEVGETVSGTGTTKATSSSTSSSSGGSSSGGTSTSGASGAKSASGASTSAADSSNAGQGSSAFAVLSNLESLQLVVALSESEIGSVHDGQIATVAIEALGGRKVAAHVVSVSQVPTSSSGAVSYDVTFQLDQGTEGLKVGMSATAEVVVKQAEGLNVPTSAIKAGSVVTVIRKGQHVTQPVTTGLAGDSSTIILSGLKAGEEVLLPTTTSTSGASLSSRIGSRLGSRGGGLGGGLGGGVGGGLPGGPPGG